MVSNGDGFKWFHVDILESLLFTKDGCSGTPFVGHSVLVLSLLLWFFHDMFLWEAWGAVY